MRCFSTFTLPFLLVVSSKIIKMKTVSDAKRNDVISLLNSGHTVSKIARRVDVSQATVRRIKKKACPDREKLKGGQPSKLTTVDKRYCVHEITKGGLDNAVQAKKEFRRNLHVNVSANTVRRILPDNGLGALPTIKQPEISDENAKDRLRWCKNKIDWTLEDWKRVIFTDEARINRFNSDGFIWCWKKDNEEIKPRHTKKTRKHGDDRIMIWCTISWSGVGWLCKIEGNINSELYKTIVDDDLEKSIDDMCRKLKLRRNQVILQQDNDSKHTSTLMKKHFETKEYRVMSWPAQSTDLNSIENMCRLLKIRLNEYDTPPEGMNDIWKRTQEIS